MLSCIYDTTTLLQYRSVGIFGQERRHFHERSLLADSTGFDRANVSAVSVIHGRDVMR